MSTLLVIDDDRALCRSLELQLHAQGHHVRHAQTAAGGLDELHREQPDLILLDLNLPDRNGIDVLEHLQELGCRVPIVMITGQQDTQATIKAMRLGAFDYLRKPFDVDDVVLLLEKTAQLHARLGRAGIPVVPVSEGPHEIVGADKKIVEVIKQIGLLSRNRVNVLLAGESGTGKELVARALHEAATPAEPFVAINCSAIVATLPESEFFGHERGAFTGADSRKIGKLEYAGEGTAFFDEIGDMPPDLQAKLLRVLQEREFQRVGGLENLPFRARVIAASNKDLETATQQGSFRADLFYRLAVARITLPPLRERREDIPLLVRHLLYRISGQLHRQITAIEDAALARLQSYSWPGNIRELENVLTRAAVLSRGGVLTADLLEFSLLGLPETTAPPSVIAPLREAEKTHIKHALAATRWNITQTAQLLEISPTTLRKKIADFKLSESE